MPIFFTSLVTGVATGIIFSYGSWTIFAILTAVIIAASILLQLSTVYFDNGVTIHVLHDPYIGGAYTYASFIVFVASGTQSALCLLAGVIYTANTVIAGEAALPFSTIGILLVGLLLAAVAYYNFLQVTFAIDVSDNAKAYSIQKL